MTPASAAPSHPPSAAPTTLRRLAELRPGTRARIASVEGSDAASRRLMDLGFTPGTRVTVVRRAPLGDPVLYELRGARLCLRRSEARRVRVVPE